MSVLQDFRFAIRLLLKDRWFTLAAGAALALGIAVNTAVFTFVNAVLFRSLPFHDADRIMWIGMHDTRGREFGVSLQDFEDWRRAARTFSELALSFNSPFTLSEEGYVPEQYSGTYLSANSFTSIGERPAMGRGFAPEDDRPGAPGVVVIGSGVWKQRYGSDPGIIGRSVRINGADVGIVGVMSDGVRFPTNTDMWMPLSQLPPALRNAGRAARNNEVFGRLAPGVTIAQARADLTNIAAQLAREYPETNKDVIPTLGPYGEHMTGPAITLIFRALMGAVGFVLLIACANVANLLMARGARRSREIGLRVSLGATRGRIIRQLLVESVVLAVLSGIVGLALSVVGVKAFDAATQGVGKPYWITFTMDARVFAFFAVACVLTGIVFGLVPALQASKSNLTDVLKEGGHGGSAGLRTRRWTAALIVGELTLTLVLLAGAAYMMRSFLVLYRIDLGFDPSHTTTMQLVLPGQKYPRADDRIAFLRRVDERLAAVGALDAASTASAVPRGGGAARQLQIDGQPRGNGERLPIVTMLSTGTHYFESLGATLVRGRGFTGAEGTPGHEAAIVNERFVAMYMKGDDPIGKRILLTEETPTGPQPGWATIVGLAPNICQRCRGYTEQDPVVYVPHAQNAGSARAILFVRTHDDPAKMTSLIRQEVRALDPDMPLFNIQTMDQYLAQLRWPFRVFGSMFAIFAGIALVLAAVGLYAVTAYSVAQRTHEIGIRMALGAQARQVRWLILRRGVIQLLVGLLLGMPGAFAVGTLLRSLLVQTGSDWITLWAIAIMLVVVAVAACYWPARRATRLDPVVALRYE